MWATYAGWAAASGWLAHAVGTSVVGGSELSLLSAKPVAHVRALGGEIRSVEGRIVRWRAPSVCAPVDVEIVFQDDQGQEETLAVTVLRAPVPDAMSLIRRPAGAVEVQVASNAAPILAADEGQIEIVERRDGCVRSLWNLPAARRPGGTLVAAFDGPRQIHWRGLARSASAVLDVQAPPEATVLARIGTRLFRGEASADVIVRIPVEVPPDATQAEARWAGRTQVIDLAPPPWMPDRFVAAPDGALWLLRMDASGAPYDGAAPLGSERFAAGTYRLSGTGAAAPTAPKPLRMPPRNERSARAPIYERPVAQAWRAGPSLKLGATRNPGLALMGARRVKSTRSIDLHGAGALLLDRARQALNDNGRPVDKWVLGFAGWGEAALPLTWGRVRIAPAAGIGGTVAWRTIRADFQGAADDWTAGPLATFALRGGAGVIQLEARALIAPFAAQFVASPWSWLVGASYGWDH